MGCRQDLPLGGYARRDLAPRHARATRIAPQLKGLLRKERAHQEPRRWQPICQPLKLPAERAEEGAPLRLWLSCEPICLRFIVDFSH